MYPKQVYFLHGTDVGNPFFRREADHISFKVNTAVKHTRAAEPEHLYREFFPKISENIILIIQDADVIFCLV